MNILVINSGSSSIKYQLFDTTSKRVLANGIVARIGEKRSNLKHHAAGEKINLKATISSHREGLELIVKTLLDKNHGVISSLSEISAVGHRVVHGGDRFTESTLITDEVVKKIKECIPLAPLHNPANLMGIEVARMLIPDVPHVAVFDTSFHQTIPGKAYLYALPYEYYQKYGIRKYGFHGTSCRYVSQRAAEILKVTLDELRMIVCHLGNGVTVDAIDCGNSVDTSMGFTPLEGVTMGTRSGDIDPGVLLFLSREIGFSHDRIDKLLNKESGLLGLSGVSNDVREIMEQCECGNDRCKLAIELFVYRIKKYIGSYAAILNGIDALVFTAGIGENSPQLREMICGNLEVLGMHLDKTKNLKIIASEGIISDPDSKVAILVIPTNEEKMIALDTVKIILDGGES